MARRVLRWLESDPGQKFGIFAVGAILLMLGLCGLIYAEHRLPDTPARRDFVLLALGLSAIGGVTALVGYLGLSIGRILKFFRDD